MMKRGVDLEEAFAVGNTKARGGETNRESHLMDIIRAGGNTESLDHQFTPQNANTSSHNQEVELVSQNIKNIL